MCSPSKLLPLLTMRRTTSNIMTRVLIVEDNEMNRDMLTRRLERKGFSIVTAEDGEAALLAINTSQPDIVLMDIQLTGKKGLELLKYIAQAYPAVTVVVLTNQVSVYYQRLCKELGAGFFIDKSKDFDRIPEIIRSI